MPPDEPTCGFRHEQYNYRMVIDDGLRNICAGLIYLSNVCTHLTLSRVRLTLRIKKLLFMRFYIKSKINLCNKVR